MSKKAWIIFSIIAVALIAIVLVVMLFLIPQLKASNVQISNYEPIPKQEYTFNGNSVGSLVKEYNVTPEDISNGIRANKYNEGNINPFTPKKEVTIYNEPTIGNNNSNGSNLTPGDK